MDLQSKLISKHPDFPYNGEEFCQLFETVTKEIPNLADFLQRRLLAISTNTQDSFPPELTQIDIDFLATQCSVKQELDKRINANS